MTGNARLVGAVAVSTVSLLALLWYFQRKSKPSKKPTIKKTNSSQNNFSNETDVKTNLRHISSQPLLAESSENLLSNDVQDDRGVEQEVEREEIVIEENIQLQSSGAMLGSSPVVRSDDTSSILSDIITNQGIEPSTDTSHSRNDIGAVRNDLNKSRNEDPSSSKLFNGTRSELQNLNLSSHEKVASKDVSVLNEALTASRMNEFSFMDRTESDNVVNEVMTSSRANDVSYPNIFESESREDNTETRQESEQDALSISTMVPLLESTNLDMTVSNARENDSNNDRAETSLNSSTSRPEQKRSHKASSDSFRRNRNDSNCSSHSASHLEDRISDTSSDRTASPHKGRDSVSPSKDHHGVLENGVQSSDGSNCDSASGESDKERNGLPTGNKHAVLVYRCNFPTELCGRLIGKYGKNINYIKERSGANVALNTNPFTPAFQLCTIEGTQKQIDYALSMISKRFPDVDLGPVNIPGLNDSAVPGPIANPLIMPEIMQLNLPEGVSVDVVVSSIVDAGHIFMQQPTHPSFPSLERLNQYMNACYTQDGIVPQLPRPLEVGVICTAPVMDGWYRAQVTAVYEENDECDVKFVDYGGFSRVPGAVLRQIRSDFMTLPFQGIECYMANVTPLQDEEFFSSEAAAVLEELTQGKLLQAQVVGRNEDGIAYCHIYQISGDKVVFVNRELVNRGVVRWIEILS